jgi:hypothetical protein
VTSSCSGILPSCSAKEGEKSGVEAEEIHGTGFQQRGDKKAIGDWRFA